MDWAIPKYIAELIVSIFVGIFGVIAWSSNDPIATIKKLYRNLRGVPSEPDRRD